MASTIKPSRAPRLSVVFAITLFICIGLTMSASSITNARNAPDRSYSESYGCNKKLSRTDDATWACLRLYSPTSAVVGETVTLRLTFKARKRLKNVTFSISNPNKPGKSIYKKKFRVIEKGHAITRSVKVTITSIPVSTRLYGQGLSHDGSLWQAIRSFAISLPPE